MRKNPFRYVLLVSATLCSTLGLACASADILTLSPDSPDSSHVRLLLDITARYDPASGLVWLGAPPGSATSGAEVSVTVEPQYSAKLRALSDGSFFCKFPGDENSVATLQWTDGWGQYRTEQVAVSDPADDLQTDIASAGLFPNRLYVIGDTVWVVNSGDDELASYDLQTLEPRALEISTPKYSNPWEADFMLTSPAGVLTTLFGGVYQFNYSTGESAPVDTTGFRAFASPNGVAILGGTAWVANPNPISYFPSAFDVGWLSEIELGADPKVVAEIETDWFNPQNVITDGRYVYVSCTGTVDFAPPDYLPAALDSGAVQVIDPANRKIIASYDLGRGGPGPMAISPDRRYLYVGSNVAGHIFRIDLFNDTVLNDSSNPIVIDDSVMTYIPMLEMLPNGLLVCPSFNTDTIHFIDSFTGNVDPAPYFAPIDLHQGMEDWDLYGVQDVAYCERDGRRGLLVLTTVKSAFHWLPLD
jgi:hypothetical protein